MKNAYWEDTVILNSSYRQKMVREIIQHKILLFPKDEVALILTGSESENRETKWLRRNN